MMRRNYSSAPNVAGQGGTTKQNDRKINKQMENEKAVGKYIIIKDLEFSDFMKNDEGKIKLYDTIGEAAETCGMY